MCQYTAYYRKHDRNSTGRYLFGGDNLPDVIKGEELDTDFIPIMVLEAEGMEDAWLQMQGECWSPNGEARQCIQEYGLSHTSMSVGDVFYNHQNGGYYMVDSFGFKEIEISG